MRVSVRGRLGPNPSREFCCCIAFGLFGLALVELSELAGITHKSSRHPFTSRGIRSFALCGLFGWALAKFSKVPNRNDRSCSIQSPAAPLRVAYCSICMEAKPLLESFVIRLCSHSFCSDCVRSYVAVKVLESAGTIKCPNPDCKDGFLEPDMCRPILAPNVLDRWSRLLCESTITAKFYCPFRDCSAVLVDERAGNRDAIRESECPHCNRLFCASCEVPWHSGFKCGEYRKLGADERGEYDLKLVQMAKTHKWQRCPKCRFYVERTKGCRLMKCRCGFMFCYGCGSKMEDHYCPKCLLANPGYGNTLK